MHLETIFFFARGKKLQYGIACFVFRNTFIKRAFNDLRNLFLHSWKIVFQYLLYQFKRNIITDFTVDNSQREFTREIDDILDIGIVDDFDISGRIGDFCRTDTDFRYRSSEAIDGDNLTDIVFIFKDDEDTGDDISDKRLRTKTDDKSDDADRFPDGSCINAEGA